MAFFALSFLPVSNLIPFGATMAERYMYIPSFAVCLGIAALFDRLPHVRYKYIPAFLILCALTFFTVHRIGAWRNDVSLWSDTLACAPASAEAHINLANAYMLAGMTDRAIDLYLEAPETGDSYDAGKYYYDLGLAYEKTGRYDRARAAFESSVKFNPRSPEPYYHLGRIAAAGGDIESGLKMMEAGIKADPENALSYYVAARYIMQNYRDGESIKKAGKWLRHAVRIEPSSGLYYGSLGEALLRLGLFADAEKALLSSVRNDPGQLASYRLLIRLYETTGQPARAMEIRKKMSTALPKK